MQSGREVKVPRFAREEDRAPRAAAVPPTEESETTRPGKLHRALQGH